MFSQAVIEKLGYYVYFLRDPRDQKIFYIGKGKGNRIFEHINCVLENPIESDKVSCIKEILEKGYKVEHFLLRHGLSEETALEIESAAIDLVGLNNLANQVAGHNFYERGIKTVDEIIQLYDAKIITIDEPVIIININRYFKRFISDEELYNITRNCWVLGKRREKAKYAISAYRGLVREVYKVFEWKEVDVGNGKKRWEFIGEVAEKEIRDKYINCSLAMYIKAGAQNPIRYVNC